MLVLFSLCTWYLYVCKIRIKLVSLIHPFQEAIWCSVPLKGAENLLVGVIYRCPRSSESNDTNLMDLLKQGQDLGATYTIITGDFNFPNVDWSHWSSPMVKSSC